MANLGDLTYSLSLEDKAFQEAITRAVQAAEKLDQGSSIKVTYDDVTNANVALAELLKSINAIGTKDIDATINKQLSDTTAKAQELSKELSNISNGNSVGTNNITFTPEQLDSVRACVTSFTELQSAINNVKSALDTLQSTDKKGVNIKATYSTVEKAASALEALTKNLEGLESQNKVFNIQVTGIPQANSTLTFSGEITNADALKKTLEDKLSTPPIIINNVQVDPTSLKNQLKAEMWNINVTTDEGGIQKLVNKIKGVLGLNNITIKVAPNMSEDQLKKLRTRIESYLKDVPCTIKVTRSQAQAQLREIKGLEVPVEIKLRTDTLQSQLNQIKAQINLSNANLNNGGGNPNTIPNQNRDIKEQNKHLTDNLGIRRSINDQMSRNTMLATMFGNAIGNVFATYQLTRFLEELIKIGGEIQKQRLALGHILQSESNAGTIFSQMKDLAVKSPFGLLDLMQNARQLSAFGVEYNKLYDTMKRLSDVAAGLGIQFGRLSLAYGETLERGFLDGKLIRQLAYQGIPVLQKVAEYYTEIKKNGKDIYNASEVRKMVSNREVSFEDFDAVIKRMTEEGGQFANMQEVMAESVAGKWKNVKDAYDIMLSDMVEGNSAILKMPAEILIQLTRNYDQLSKVLYLVAATMISAKGASALYAATMGKEATASMSAFMAERQRTQQMALRNAALQKMSFLDQVRLATTRKLTAEEIKQAIAKGTLNKEDELAYALKLKVNKANASYLYNLGLINAQTYQNITTGGVFKRNLGLLRGELALFGIQAKQAAASLAAMTASMLLNPITWLMAGATALWMWKSNADKLEETMERVRDRTAEAKDEILKGTIDLKQKVNIDVDSLDRGTLSTLVKEMTEFIKDKAADAPNIIEAIFAKDKDGHYIKDLKTQFKELRDIIEEMNQYGNSTMDFSESISKALDGVDGIFDDSALTNTKEFLTSQSKLTKVISDSVMRNADAASKAFDKVREVYRAKLIEIFNVDDVSKVTETQLRMLLTKNKGMLDAFLKEYNQNAGFNGKNLSNILNTQAYEDYVSDYKNMLQDILSASISAKRDIDTLYAAKGKKGVDWNDPDIQRQWEQDVVQTIQVKYGDENAQQASVLISTLLRDPNVRAMVNADAKTTSADYEAMQILQKGDIYKNVWLMPKVIKETPNEDPYEKAFGIDAKGSGDYVSAIEAVEKKAKEHYSKLYRLQKEGKIKLQKGADGLYNITNLKGDADALWWKDATTDIHAFNNELRNAKEQGISLDYLTKATGKTTPSKEDTWLADQKEKFDELKKAFSEFQKWAKVVGNDKAIEEVNKIVNFSQFKNIGIKEGDLFDEKSFKVAVEKYYDSIKKQLNTTQRRKFGNNVKVEMSNIEFTGVQKASQELAKNIQEEINNAMKQWDVYKSWFGVTGDKELSLSVAMNIKPLETEESKYFYADLEKKLEAEVKKGKINELDLGNLLNFENKTASAEMLFTKAGMQEYFSLWQKVKELMVSGGFELAKDMANVLKNTDDYETKISAIRNNLVEQIKRINSNYDGKTKQMLIDEETRQAQEKINKLTIESMKKTMNWDMLFNNANGLSKETLDVLHNKLQILIDDMSKLSNPDVQSIKTLTDMLDKIKGLQAERGNVFSNITKSFKNMSSAYEKLDILNNNKSRVGISDLYKQYKEAKVGSEDYSRIMKTQVTVYTEKGTMEIMKFEEYLKLLTKAEADAANQNNNFAKSMKKLGKDISSISNIAKSALTPILGSLGGGGYFGDVANSVLGTLDTVGSAIDKIDFSKPLSLDSIQGYTDIASSFVSLSQSINNANAAAFERELKNLESRSQNLVSIFEMLAEEIKESLGMAGIGELESSTNQLVNNYQKAIESIISTAKDKMAVRYKNDAGYTRHSYGYYLWKGDDRANLRYSALSKAAEDINKKFGTNIQSTNDFFSLTKEQMEYFITTYPTLISQNSDFYDAIMALYTYLKKVDEVNLADNFFGGNDTEFLNNWVSLVQDMSKTADDFCDDFENSLSDAIIKSMVNTEFKEQIQALREKMNAYAQDGLSIEEADDLRADAEALSKALAERRKMYEEMGLIKNTDDSSTASSSIQGVTEETADILAQLIQGIRLDLSLQRLAVESVRDAIGSGQRDLNTIAEAQLTQLDAIAQHTYDMHQSLVTLNSKVDEITNGTKSLHIE